MLEVLVRILQNFVGDKFLVNTAPFSLVSRLPEVRSRFDDDDAEGRLTWLFEKRRVPSNDNPRVWLGLRWGEERYGELWAETCAAAMPGYGRSELSLANEANVGWRGLFMESMLWAFRTPLDFGVVGVLMSATGAIAIVCDDLIMAALTAESIP